MYKKTAKSLFKDKTNIYVSECLSTNDFLTQLSKKSNLNEGSSVITDYQINGKGQRNNIWESERGQNLLFSFLLKPHIPIKYLFKLHIITSLAIRDTLMNLGLKEVKIKWPNDIYVFDKKISGILIENQIFNRKLKQVIVGIGLNVNQSEFNNLNATSIFKEIDNKLFLNNVFSLLRKSIKNKYYDIHRSMEELIHEYQQDLYKFKSYQNFIYNKKSFNGRIVGVLHDGRINIEFNGKKEKFDFGSVRFL
jgi:BirA family biotin operon repressor/biotin-[acetyl-CoA-carboxylase] ligase